MLYFYRKTARNCHSQLSNSIFSNPPSAFWEGYGGELVRDGGGRGEVFIPPILWREFVDEVFVPLLGGGTGEAFNT